MKIIGIKTNKGYYITDVMENNPYNRSYLSDKIINGEKIEKTHHVFWSFTKTEPKKIQQLQSRPNINKRWELRDEDLSDKFKKTYLEEEVFSHYDEDYGNVYSDEFSKIKSLYDFKSDAQEPELVDIDFEYQTIEEIEEIPSPTPFSYRRLGQWNKEINPITNKDVKHDMIDEIITPSLLLHKKPSKLSTKETYDIIRAYIKNNINPKVAEITSDYDFCFTVKKKIELTKVHEYKVDVNNSIFGGRKRKPKYETRLQKTNNVTVFEMCPAPYQSYTVIKPFEAESEDELKEYIDNYLNHLIEVINEPLKYCKCCEGTGVEFVK